MRRILLICLLLSFTLVPTAGGQDSGFTRCSEHEVRILLLSLFDLEVLDFRPIETVDDIVRRGTALLEARDSSYGLLPLCAEAITMQRSVIMIKGDKVGQAALRMAGVPDGANPYSLHYPDLLDLEKTLSPDILSDLRSEDIESEGRRLPSCSASDLADLNALATGFEAAYARASETGDEVLWIIAVNQILTWRIENMSTLPDCLEAIELGYWLSKATTDAAVQFALNHAEVAAEDNPYGATVNRARELLSSWRDQLRLAKPEHQGAIVVALGPASQLPACSIEQIEKAYDVLQNDVLDLTLRLSNPGGPDDLAQFAAEHMALRNSFLAAAPVCAETFEGIWLTRQVLGDYIAWASLLTLGYLPDRNPFNDQVVEKVLQLKGWISDTKEYLQRVEDSEGMAPEGGDLPSCRDGEVTYMIGYAMPDFDNLMNALFDKSDDFDVIKVIRDSFKLRDQLWLNLPRCKQALAVGNMMRQIIGDMMPSIALNVAGVNSADIPYIAEHHRDLDSLDDLQLELLATTDGAASATAAENHYYVTANPYVNIRACASTSCDIVATARYGEGLTVIDDSSDWYEVRLEGGETAFIAGYLMSKTPPDA
ncbi:MAG: SH3 domain-containing protein [Chloroflexi bacterium]|nr:SH3 domain-containing protein [Chloroflexota bacterium]